MNISFKFTKYLLIICLSAPYCYGNLSALHFKKYHKHNSSLTNNRIYHIVEDSKGFIWLATGLGVRRFDGINFQSLESITGNPQTSHLNVDIKQLLFDSHENLWIGTLENGVYKLNTKNYQLQHFHPNNKLLTSGFFRRITEDNSSNIWIATSNGISKFNLFSNNTKNFSKVKLKLGDKEIYSFEYSLMDNMLWIGTDRGIVHFNPNTQTTVDTNNNSNNRFLHNKMITYMHYDKIEKLWIGTLNSLFVYDYQEKAYKPVITPKERRLDFIYSINSDANQRLWIGTSNEILVVNKQELNILWSMPTNDLSEQRNNVYDIHINSDKQLWIATHDSGLWKANMSNLVFDVYNADNKDEVTIKNNKVIKIHEDHKQNPLIATEGYGIDYTDKSTNKWSHYPSSYFFESHPNKYIQSITGTKENIWLNAANKIAYYNTITQNITHIPITKYQHKKNDKSDIHSLFYDSQQRLWVLFMPHWLSYIDLYSDESTFFSPNDVNNKNIKNIYETNDNEILLLTNQSLLRYDSTNSIFIEQIIKVDGISNLVINTIADSLSGNLWLGTDQGLIKYNMHNKEVEHYTINDGLPNNVVVGILADNNENLWLATYNGLSRFHYPTKHFDNFYEEDGLPDNEFDASTSFKSTSGHMYFAGSNGVIYL